MASKSQACDPSSAALIRVCIYIHELYGNYDYYDYTFEVFVGSALYL